MTCEDIGSCSPDDPLLNTLANRGNKSSWNPKSHVDFRLKCLISFGRGLGSRVYFLDSGPGFVLVISFSYYLIC